MLIEEIVGDKNIALTYLNLKCLSPLIATTIVIAFNLLLNQQCIVQQQFSEGKVHSFRMNEIFYHGYR